QQLSFFGGRPLHLQIIVVRTLCDCNRGSYTTRSFTRSNPRVCLGRCFIRSILTPLITRTSSLIKKVNRIKHYCSLFCYWHYILAICCPFL
uniref:Uncharacterized protein n=1 Tax=Dicentrarchus labrax TaxID=13489 RepID=A0A8P4G8H8_DICLA